MTERNNDKRHVSFSNHHRVIVCITYSPFDFSWVFHPTNTILFHAFPEPERLRFMGGNVRNTVHGHPPMS